MIDEIFLQGRKRPKLNLQLTPLVDVFVLLIVFLLKTTSVNSSNVQVSPDIKVPISGLSSEVIGKSSLEVSMQRVQIKFLNREFSKDQLTDTVFLKELLRALKKHVSSQKDRSVSLVVDSKLEYQDVFFIVELLKVAGFSEVNVLARSGVL